MISTVGMDLEISSAGIGYDPVRVKHNIDPGVSKILYTRTAQIHQLLTVDKLYASALGGHHRSSDVS